MTESVIPAAVYTIWWIGLLVVLIFGVPRAVFLLHRTWTASRSIQRYAAGALEAAAGIAGNTVHISALDDTITVAGDILATAGGIAAKLETTADVLAARAER